MTSSKLIQTCIHSEVRLLGDIKADFSDRHIPKGTRGTIVERYDKPDAVAVDLAIPDTGLVGGYRYENVILTPPQFEIIKR
ncbi:hypothetical protein C1752_03164 [Acaryochloris thomasi RCC1774]|uniref:DUF4926 domain-containing protein n=1 Tax=Acaryochloris thomasi RCC1774 TaxID=1764569 RepID=A0A2W1JX10_9CYAN|nr:hypothetical protein [Acaryochloris thomasi]PZD72897.1 hypothetical protein C1752_03164 [Acaryochloris thomasi RCC1774]